MRLSGIWPAWVRIVPRVVLRNLHHVIEDLNDMPCTKPVQWWMHQHLVLDETQQVPHECRSAFVGIGNPEALWTLC